MNTNCPHPEQAPSPVACVLDCWSPLKLFGAPLVLRPASDPSLQRSAWTFQPFRRLKAGSPLSPITRLRLLAETRTM